MIFLIIGGLLLVATGIYIIRHPVLVRFSEGPLAGDRRFILLSPFRDREPEKVASEFLIRLRSGECNEAIGALGWSAEKHKLICEKELAFPMANPQLIDRIDQESHIKLRYVWYGAQGNLGSFLELQIGGARGNRKVIDYDRSY